MASTAISSVPERISSSPTPTAWCAPSCVTSESRNDSRNSTSRRPSSRFWPVDAEKRNVLIAGSLPPLSDSYLPDEVEPEDVLEELYTEQAAILAPYVDLFICETLTTVAETRASAKGAAATGKPVWIGWTLNERKDACLKDGTSVLDAAESVADQPVSAFVANCCTPEAVTRALPSLLETGLPTGGYANTFAPIDPGQTDIGHRHDLDPESYRDHVAQWITAGARVVGGCCGTMPQHIALLRSLIDDTAPAA